jgi:hypothetical protein
MAPMSTSRMMPPVVAATIESTSTPNTSNPRFAAATAPLSANTNVPMKSSAVTNRCMAGATGSVTVPFSGVSHPAVTLSRPVAV